MAGQEELEGFPPVERPASEQRERPAPPANSGRDPQPERRGPQPEHHGPEPGLITVGHGAAREEEFIELLRDAAITALVDVRRYPGSRAHPHFGREAMSGWLGTAGIAYRWDPRLGGRRSLPPDSPDVWWEVTAFRAYADHMRTSEFRDAIVDLLAGARTDSTAIMCSESLWWRCHRRMVSDFVTLTSDFSVRHLDHRGRLTPHPVADGARVTMEGLLVYDRPARPH